MLKGEMNHHLGYENNDHGSKTTDYKDEYITPVIIFDDFTTDSKFVDFPHIYCFDG